VLHALLHGKLHSTLAEPERREDALTSTVFGTLVLLDAWGLIGKWLNVPEGQSSDSGAPECWFWPRLAGAVEPDVLLRLGEYLVVVEAKYRSDRHDLSPDDVDDERPVDQIVRQYHAVSPPHDRRSPYPESLERAVRECRILQVFLVDAKRIRQARLEHAESVSCLSKVSAGATVTLATWQALYSLLLAPDWSRARWAIDLRAYLRICGLASFQGVRRDLASAEHLQTISNWRPVPVRPVVPTLRAAASMLASEPAIGELLRWRAASASERGRDQL
jgi:hypothetical protein